MRTQGKRNFERYDDDANHSEYEENEIGLPTLGLHLCIVPVLLKASFATPAKLVCTLSAFHMWTSTVLIDHDSAIRTR